MMNASQGDRPAEFNQIPKQKQLIPDNILNRFIATVYTTTTVNCASTTTCTLSTTACAARRRHQKWISALTDTEISATSVVAMLRKSFNINYNNFQNKSLL